MRYITLLALTGLAAAATGCASAPLPTAEVARAQTLVEQAERNQAQQFAAADLDRAREKLQRSQAAIDAKDAEVARRYATEAALDAELALAKSSTAQAEKSAAEVRASIDDLKIESQRGTSRP